MNQLSKLETEKRNKHSLLIDSLSTREILKIINNEDLQVARRVREVLPDIELAVQMVYTSFQNGGSLFYVGAGTSGRIGVVDAVECPPTFSTSPNFVQAIIAGGNDAFVRAKEGVEDNEMLGAEALKSRCLKKEDVVIGIAASGRTPFVVGALKYAQSIGVKTVSLTSNKHSLISDYADVQIEVETGPEILTGSTRMKAATAHKLIANMITTTSMIKVGKVYENLMVDLHVSNEKLLERAKNIIMTITGVTYEKAGEYLVKTNNKVKPALVMIEADVDLKTATESIERANGFVRNAIDIALTYKES